MGQLEITDEHALESMGDAALGIITSAITTGATIEDERGFVKPITPSSSASRLLLDRRLGRHASDLCALKKTNGNTDGEALINAARA